jgi:ribosomal protein S18 acetylase RimI-like enzyme
METTGQVQQAIDAAVAGGRMAFPGGSDAVNPARAGVRVDPVRVADLPALARAAMADPVRYPLLPISPMRAQAQALNPLANPDDVGLLVGFVEDRCAGFLGLLPGAVEFRGRRHPVSSFTGFHVAPADHGRDLATMLARAAIELGRDLYVARVGPDIRALLTPLGFRPAPVPRTLRLRLSRLGKLKGIPLRVLVRSVGGGHIEDRWRLVTEARAPMSAQGADGAPSAGERPRFVRDERVINWTIRHPWIGEDSHAALRYPLPYRREMFRYLTFEANGGGFVVLCITQEQRCATLRILDRRPTTDEQRAPALARALVEAQRLVADVVECPAEYEPLLRRSLAGRMLLASEDPGALVSTRDPEGPFGKHLDTFEWSGFEGDATFS